MVKAELHYSVFGFKLEGFGRGHCNGLVLAVDLNVLRQCT